MFVNFDDVFRPVVFPERLTDLCPCLGCDELNYFTNNPYYQSERCDACRERIMWTAQCIQKLHLLEHPEPQIASKNDAE